MSPLAQTTTVTMGALVAALLPLEIGEVSAGIVEGAVKTPFALPDCPVIEPQPGLQDFPRGEAEPQGPPLMRAGKLLQVFVLLLESISGCMTAQFKVVGGVLAREAVKEICCAGLMPTGAAAVAGVTEARMPVSMAMTAVPVFLVSALEVAVKVIVGIGFGKLERVGAV